MGRINMTVKRLLSPQDAIRAVFLRQEALVAASKGFQPTALGRAIELAAFAPEAAARLGLEPAFASIKLDLERALQRLVPAARVAAQERLAQAEQIQFRKSSLETAKVLAAARHFFRAGTHSGYLRSAVLAQVLIDHYVLMTRPSMPLRRPGPEKTMHVPVHFEKRKFRMVSASWSQAPLLVLLLAWLAAGIAGGVFYRVSCHLHSDVLQPVLADLGFGTWGIGFLALVGLGFYAKVRYVKFTLDR
jgi:hypothetical protein